MSDNQNKDIIQNKPQQEPAEKGKQSEPHEPYEITYEGDGDQQVAIEKYKNGDIIRRSKNGRWLPGTKTGGGHLKKPYQYSTIASKVRDIKTLEAAYGRLYQLATEAKNPRIILQALRDIAELEGFKTNKIEIDASIQAPSIDNLNDIISKVFGLNGQSSKPE